jgi:hypothetical protein
MPHSYTPTFIIDIWEETAFENELSTKRKQHVFSETTLNLKKTFIPSCSPSIFLQYNERSRLIRYFLLVHNSKQDDTNNAFKVHWLVLLFVLSLEMEEEEQVSFAELDFL